MQKPTGMIGFVRAMIETRYLTFEDGTELGVSGEVRFKINEN